MLSQSLFLGATVWAGAECPPQRAWLLVEGDRVAAVGNTGEPPPWADRVLRLPGCHVLPGFTDVHLHLSQAAWFGHGGDGSLWRSVAEALDAVTLAAAASPQAPWLLFWNVERWTWPHGRLPTSGELEAAAPDRAVLISTSDMHRGAISAVGLVAAGLAGRAARAAFGDDLSRDRRGRLTGGLWEAAFGIAVQRALADCAAHAEHTGPHAVLAAEAGRYLAHGITHAHDPYVAPDLHQQMTALDAAGLHTPYLRYTDPELAGLVTSYAAAGVRLRIHALGNLAGHQAARILRQAGVPPGGATIDHLMLLDPATADAVAASGATVSYQPGFLPRYRQMLTGSRADRYCTVFGGRLLLDAGCPLVISSDHPSGPLDPLANLRAAVSRHTGDSHVLQPDQALTQQEAVRAATVTAAASLGLPGGGLAAGQPADLVVCTGHPFAPGTRITQTWIAGQHAWPPQAGEHAP